MIVKVNRTGVESNNCSTSVVFPRGVRTVQLMSIRLPDNAAAMFPEFVNAVVANGQTFTIPALHSIDDLVSFMNGINAPGRVWECWYNSDTNDFELATKTYNSVAISTEFANYFQFPTNTIVSFESGRINPSMNPVHEYVVEIDAYQDGAHEVDAYTSAIGYVDGPRGKPYEAHAFVVPQAVQSVGVRVKYRLKSGELCICNCDNDEMWSVCLRLND